MNDIRQAALPLIDDEVACFGDRLVVLRGFACRTAGGSTALRAQAESIAAQAPWRQMRTPNGGRTSVAMTNCGALGWTSDLRGYRYRPDDPLTGQPWPAMPARWQALARDAAAAAGFGDFAPDACLVNRYVHGTRLSLHQDRNERDRSRPIVSVSLGASCVFLWGGRTRSAPIRRMPLHDGDVLVWGAGDRMNFHGVAPLRMPTPEAIRINLTFRVAG